MEKETKNIKRIVLIGPESTGKTELASQLASEFNTVVIPEYARNYIEQLGREYTYTDVELIAKKQIELERQFEEKANGVLFYDTFLIITKVWFQVVFKKTPDWIDEKIKESNIDLFLLCNTDIPWIKDKVRENGGEMREQLFDIYRNELENYGFNYKVIAGKGTLRFDNALKIVKDFLNDK
ncbi:MAG: ATP-binding protein [Bacteroidales bacterium]|nr:ATP-binding protein [Bacteroidales bacterium]